VRTAHFPSALALMVAAVTLTVGACGSDTGGPGPGTGGSSGSHDGASAGTGGGPGQVDGATSGAGGSVGTGGALATGGSLGAGGAVGTGGAKASGGILGAGGSGAGGDTQSDAGCAPGWTMCCGQCLSPQAGICAPCSGTGGAKASGGAGAGGGGAGGSADVATTDAASGTCSTLTTQAACDDRSDCHSVFADPGTCGCAGVNCCMHFNHCADGGHANCSGPVACAVAQPSCTLPYTLSYANNCFEGCVLQTECAGVDAAVTTPACPQTAPANGSSCGSTSMSCFYDNCPSTGRTQSTCTGGTWAVQTAACGAVSCVGSPGVTTCPSGQLCLITESGTISVQCVSNTCGQGPISPACASGLSGCVVNATLNGGVTITCNQCPQGGCA